MILLSWVAYAMVKRTTRYTVLLEGRKEKKNAARAPNYVTSVDSAVFSPSDGDITMVPFDMTRASF